MKGTIVSSRWAVSVELTSYTPPWFLQSAESFRVGSVGSSGSPRGKPYQSHRDSGNSRFRGGPRISKMISQIALCPATTLVVGVRLGCLCVCVRARARACGWVDMYERVPCGTCARDAESRMGPKVVGILLEGEKYEPAVEALPTACVRDRIGRKRARDREAGENEKDGAYSRAGLLRTPFSLCSLKN